eukprot:s4036_g14.t1
MTPGKSGGKGKGKAISKGYQFSHHIQSLFKGAVGKDKGFSDVGKTRLGKVATDIDARQSASGLKVAEEQSASGLKVAEESLPGQLDRALQRLELMKRGRNFWKRGGKRRPIRVLVHCHGGINRTCAAFCALVMAFASMSMEQAIAKWIKTRAYYAPFLHREYMIEALLELQEELPRTDIDH